MDARPYGTAANLQLEHGRTAHVRPRAERSRLWFLDQLVAEEEQADRPEGLHGHLERPPALSGGAPGRDSHYRQLRSSLPRRRGPAVRPGNLEWSHRVLGPAARPSRVLPGPAGAGQARFTIVPGDFETNGPHRLVLETRVRTAGLTDSWELEPPHVPFNLEFDPFLQLDAITTLPDSTRDEQIQQAIRLELAEARDGEPATYLSLNADGRCAIRRGSP